MPHVDVCPEVAQYQQLAAGRLAEVDEEALLEHLESCGICGQKLATLTEPDTLVELIGRGRAQKHTAADGVLGRLVARLSKLRPGGAPAGAEQTTPPAPTAQGQQSAKHYDFLAPPRARDELGRLGPYRVLEVLGTGGMGVVFRAEDPQLARLVALKAMLPGSMASENARQRFLREAQAAAAIKHDHIVSIYQVGEDRGALYLAMELLDGEPLDARLQRQGKLPVAEVLRIGRQSALGLAAAHKRGLIHRDIKPANIWLESETNRVKILDFGLARTAGGNAHLTQEGVIVGTPAYMAPEQGKGRDVDQRCDLFSLGCVLYRMATGAAPFSGTDVISTLVSVATETPCPPRELEPALPKKLSELIVSLLAKDAADRPTSAQVVAEALEHIALDVVRPVTPKKPRPWWAAAGVAAALAAVLIGLSAGGVFRLRTPDGVLVIEVNETNPEVFVDGNKITVTWDQGGKKAEIGIKPGTRKVEVKVMKEGFGIVSEFVELQAGGRNIFTARLERTPTPLMKPKSETALPRTYKNTLGMEFVLIPKGWAWLGGSAGKLGHREVTIPQDFYLGVYEVTQEEWEKVMGNKPSYFSSTGGGKDQVKDIPDAELKRFPVENVTPHDSLLLLERLNKREKEKGWTYRLPKADEWEYACRDGPMADSADSAFDFYFDKPKNELLPDEANFKETGLRRTCRVGSYKPNRLGLYDMHGNVWEWCDDEQKAADGASRRVCRAGCWFFDSGFCRAAYRRSGAPSLQAISLGYLGLRLARVPVRAIPGK